MKRTIPGLALVALAALPLAAGAQSGGGLGLKVGGVFANVSNSGVLPNEMGSRTGFTAGLALGTRGGLIGFGAEALFVQNGLSSSAATASLKLNYLSVPAYLRIGLPTPGVRPFGYVGPQVSFELGCTIGGNTCPADTFGVGGGDRKKTTFAGVVGTGLRLGGKMGFTIEARYVYGLTDLKYGTVSSSASYQDRDLLFMAGISF